MKILILKRNFDLILRCDKRLKTLIVVTLSGRRIYFICEWSSIEGGNLVLKKVLRRALDSKLMSSMVHIIFGLSSPIGCANSNL